MSSRTITPLDKIIKKADKDKFGDADFTSLYLDEKSKQVFRKEPPFLQTIGKKIQAYLVSTIETCNSDGFGMVLENGIGLNVSYSAKCSADEESKLLNALFDEDNAFEFVLHQKMKKILRQYYAESDGAVTVNFLRGCETELRKRCLAETGMIIKPAVAFQAEGNLKDLPTKSGSFEVRVQDFNGPLVLEFDANIQASENALEKCLLEALNADDIIAEVKQIVKKEIWAHIGLNQFCLALNGSVSDPGGTGDFTAVAEALMAPVNSYLQQKGRRLGYLLLSSSTIENIVPKPQIDIEHVSAYKLADENQFIYVKSNLSLILRDIAAFKRAEERDNIKKGAKDGVDTGLLNSKIKKQ